MYIFPELFFFLVAMHITLGINFFLKFHMKWEQATNHPNQQGREYYLLRSRRQFFAAALAAFCIGYDLWFLLESENSRGATVSVFWLLIGLMTLPAIYTLGKYRYDWKDLGRHFKACWTKRELTWY